MNFDESLSDTIATLYFRILARRAAMKAEIAELSAQISHLALLLDALQQNRRGSYIDNVAKAFGISHAAAVNEQRNLRALAKRPLDKSFFVVNGMLPTPAKKTPKKAKPASAVGKAGQLTAEILKAKERGLNAQEDAIIKAMIERLSKDINK